jgi:hypothetical protein
VASRSRAKNRIQKLLFYHGSEELALAGAALADYQYYVRIESADMLCYWEERMPESIIALRFSSAGATHLRQVG